MSVTEFLSLPFATVEMASELYVTAELVAVALERESSEMN